MTTETKAKELLSQKIIRNLWPEVIFVEVGGTVDRSGIDGYIGKYSIQHKYDVKIPKFYRIWDEHVAKERGHPEQEWQKAKRIADLYIFTTGGNWENQDITGAYAICVSLSALNDIEIGKNIHEIPKEAPTSKGYFVPVRELYESEIRRVTLLLKPRMQVCDYGIPPVPNWSNCLPCPLYKDGHCFSEEAKQWTDGRLGKEV